MNADDFIDYPDGLACPELKSTCQNLVGIVINGKVIPFRTAEDQLKSFRAEWLDGPPVAKDRPRSVPHLLHLRRTPLGAVATRIGDRVLRPKFDSARPYKGRDSEEAYEGQLNPRR